MKIYISAQNSNNQYLSIKLIFDKQIPKKLSLPTWRPGRYELQNFSQNLRKMTFKSATALIESKRTNLHTWEIENNSTPLTVSYEYFANQMDAGSSWLDEKQIYINFVNCILQPIGLEEEAIEIEFDFPEFTQFASALPAIDSFTLKAENYYQLVDSPVIHSAYIQHHCFDIQGTMFHLWIQGECIPDWRTLETKFTAYTNEQINLFGEFPTKSYHYLFQILPYKHYHGVEHSSSTVITLGPKEDFHQYEFQINLLGVSSHELFHTWNVCRIRPKELAPVYDYTKENLYETGYVTEGVTTYYGDYMLARSGVFSVDEYFKEINTYLKRHFENDGRHHSSIVESSYKLWLDGYKAGAPYAKVSIYIKGALAALILDLEICKATNGEKSLDNVMRAMWSKFGRTDRGYTHEDYKKTIEEITSSDFSWYFDSIIFGTDDLTHHLHNALQYVGCYILNEPNKIASEKLFGFRTQNNKIIKMAEGSPAEKRLRIGDEISLIENSLPENHLWDENRQQVQLSVIRLNEPQSIELNCTDETFFNNYTIQKLVTADRLQQNRFENWLHHVH